MEARMTPHAMHGGQIRSTYPRAQARAIALPHAPGAPAARPAPHVHHHYEWRIPLAAGLFSLGGWAGWSLVQWLLSF